MQWQNRTACVAQIRCDKNIMRLLWKARVKQGICTECQGQLLWIGAFSFGSISSDRQYPIQLLNVYTNSNVTNYYYW